MLGCEVRTLLSECGVMHIKKQSEKAPSSRSSEMSRRKAVSGSCGAGLEPSLSLETWLVALGATGWSPQKFVLLNAETCREKAVVKTYFEWGI